MLIYYLTYNTFSHWPSPLFAAVTMEMSCDPWPRAGDQGMDINENSVTGTAHTYYTQVIQLWIHTCTIYQVIYASLFSSNSTVTLNCVLITKSKCKFKSTYTCSLQECVIFMWMHFFYFLANIAENACRKETDIYSISYRRYC